MIVIRRNDRGVHELGSGRSVLNTLQSISTEECGTALTEAVALDAEHLPVASVAVHAAVLPVTRHPGVKVARTTTTFETLFVPHMTFGEDLEENIQTKNILYFCSFYFYLICMIYKAVTGWTTLTCGSCLTILRLLLDLSVSVID